MAVLSVCSTDTDGASRLKKSLSVRTKVSGNVPDSLHRFANRVSLRTPVSALCDSSNMMQPSKSFPHHLICAFFFYTRERRRSDRVRFGRRMVFWEKAKEPFRESSSSLYPPRPDTSRLECGRESQPLSKLQRESQKRPLCLCVPLDESPTTRLFADARKPIGTLVTVL